MSTQTIQRRVPAGEYTVDPVHSSVGFAVVHNGVSAFRSGFGAYEAKLSGGEGPALTGAVEVGSIEIDEPNLKGHLLSPEFFDAERHPRLSFASSEVEVDEDGGATIRGELEIRGEKRAVEASGRIVALGGDSPARPASASRSRRASTGATSASIGRRSCPAAATRSTTGSTSRSSWSWSRRVSSDARARHLRQPAARLAQQRPAAAAAAAARRGRAGPVRRLAKIPPYDEDAELATVPAVVRDLREAIRGADAVLVATPEYNHSLPGQLKNALDWASRPAGKSALSGKPAAAIGASTGMFGAVWAQAEARKVLGALGGRVIESDLPIGHAAELRHGDRLELAPKQDKRLEEILAELVAAAEREPVAA